jgi:hypothetical protein
MVAGATAAIINVLIHGLDKAMTVVNAKSMPQSPA